MAVITNKKLPFATRAQRLNIYFSGSGGGNSKFCQGGSKINADRIKKYEEFDL